MKLEEVGEEYKEKLTQYYLQINQMKEDLIANPPTDKDELKEKIRDIMNNTSSYSVLPELMNLCLLKLKVGAEMFAELLGEHYTRCDDLYRYKDIVSYAFSVVKPYREKLMTKKELAYLDRLPDKVHIYRGMTVKESKKKSQGYSWTLKKKIAEFFAYEYRRNFSTANESKIVIEKIIDKKDILAVFLGRKEFEVIYLG